MPRPSKLAWILEILLPAMIILSVVPNTKTQKSLFAPVNEAHQTHLSHLSRQRKAVMVVGDKASWLGKFSKLTPGPKLEPKCQ